MQLSDEELDNMIEDEIKASKSMHMNLDAESRVEKMRNGEKIKCPRCDKGFISAKGNPITTKVFKCDKCQTGIILTVPYNKSTTDENKEVK